MEHGILSRAAEFVRFRGISAEFLCFRGILRNSVLRKGKVDRARMGVGGVLISLTLAVSP